MFNIENIFFIIESDSLGNVESRVYGYKYENSLSEGMGAYVNVTVDSDSIILSQDYMGSFGLYIFRNEDYFAISNSFIKLLDHVKKNFVLSLNNDFCKSFIITDCFSFDETLVEEIMLIPRNQNVIIDKASGNISFENTDYDSNNFSLDSREAMDCLDSWFDNWVSILRDLTKNSEPIIFNLEDNLESYAMLSLLLNSNIDLNNVKITADSESDISKLLDDYGLDYNTGLFTETSFNNISELVENSFYSKLGASKHMLFEPSYYEEPVYLFNTFNDTIYTNNIDDLLHDLSNRANNYSPEFSNPVSDFLTRNIRKVQKHLRYFDSFSEEFYKSFIDETFIRNTNCKDNVEYLLSNNIVLNPFHDSMINKIKYNPNIILFIISRYSPELLKYVEGNIESLKDINSKYPYNQKELELIKGKRFEVENDSSLSINNLGVESYFEKIFTSKSFKYTFIKYFNEDVYYKLYQSYADTNSFKLDRIICAITIMKVIENIEYSKFKYYNNQVDWLNSFITIDNVDKQLPIKNMLNMYNTIRVDIKNRGSPANQIKILNISDKTARITNPSWFINETGIGTLISSNANELSLKFKCIETGDLAIELRTLDVHDRNHKRFPIYIDYISFKVDDKEILDDNKLVWHDTPIRFKKTVFDEEVIKIDLKWQPFSHLSKYE